MDDQQFPRAPAGLNTAGRRLWKAINAKYEVSNPGEVVLLEQACRTLDLVADLAEVVKAEGITTTGSTGQIVVHPAVGELRFQRRLAGDLLHRLGLPDPDDPEPLENRNPPRRRNRRPS